MAPIRVLFVQDGEASGGATAAAVGADPMVELVDRAATAEAGVEALGAHPPAGRHRLRIGALSTPAAPRCARRRSAQAPSC
jgi:hypothetical protein